ncbi:hypothetical protein FN846DRAFT_989376 [Sphaerosporella brunnea]|uniref:non-specific serine/threonine protein kinase n=1 Tax=Sphaerosporella brunnea TaxID=1250544 RepID=A0A5J5EQZ1_9PEZI|nr:hypothetical protein FN846DRAFT_989376 [Sphaerosporella brunnea]
MAAARVPKTSPSTLSVALKRQMQRGPMRSTEAPSATADLAASVAMISIEALAQTSTQSTAWTTMSTPPSMNSDALRPHTFNDTGNRLKKGSKASRKVTDLSLYNELWDRVIYDVDTLWESFDDIAVPAHLHDGSRWVGWPESTLEHRVLKWFFADIHPLIQETPAAVTNDSKQSKYGPRNTRAAVKKATAAALGCTIQYVSSGNLVIKNGDANRKGDLVVRCCLPGQDRRTYWDQVRVVGELKSNPDKDGRDRTFIQLANYMRELFGTQPQRCWAFGFTLCGPLMRIFRFDRSGALGSTSIDIHEQPKLFLGAMKFFLTPDAEAMGFDPTIRWNPLNPGLDVVYDPTVHFVNWSLPDPFILAGRQKYRIYRTFIVRRYAIATRGTVCWRARPFDALADSPWSYVIKDQWRAAERDQEGDFLALIPPGTLGLPEYIWHTDVRRGPTRTNTQSGPTGTLMDVAGHVRKGIDHGAQDKGCSAISSLTDTSRNLYRTAADGIRLQNRVKTRLIMRPLGSPLLSFTSYKHLLLALRDAVLGHRHMYTVHNIVHRDVSLNNILLHPQQGTAATSPYGFLIDFDFAIDRARQGLSGADFITGTFRYMSIDVLTGKMSEPHSPIQDLESFYYVLLDIAIHYDERGALRTPKPLPTIFTGLNTEGDHDLRRFAASQKRMYLEQESFMDDVFPTFNDTAKQQLCLVADAWRELIDHTRQNRCRPRWVMDEGVPPIKLPAQRQPEDDIRTMYDTTLDILDRGIARLRE